MALDEDDLRYLLEIRETLKKALERETDSDEVGRLHAMIKDIELRISEGRIEKLQERPVKNAAPLFVVGQLVSVAQNADEARILDVKYTGIEWLYYVAVPPDPPSAYKDWFLESQLRAA
jgi:hypothetical protein